MISFGKETKNRLAVNGEFEVKRKKKKTGGRE